MDEFISLLNVAKRLLAPDGCPWDRKQNLQSMRHSLVEETFEVIEAIDLNDNDLLEEELGDLIFNAIFLCLLAEKESRFTLQATLKSLLEKLIRRHPHVFGESQAETAEDVLKQWQKIKDKEKKERRPSLLDGIPKDLPALARAQKMAKKLKNHSFNPQKDANSLEEKIGKQLWEILQSIEQEGIQAEQALRKWLTQIELEFREWEKHKYKDF